MAGSKFTELTAGAALSASDVFAAVQSGNTVKVTASQLATYFSANLPSITTVGTVTSGTWNATPITAPYGGTGFTSYTSGDLVVGATSTTTVKVALGKADQVLTVSGTLPAWSNPRIPTRSFSADTTLALTDGGGGLYHPATDTTARTVTIPANTTVAFPVGTVISIYNRSAAGAVNVQITTDTLDFPPNGGTGTRAVAASGLATLWKVDSTVWVIGGTGVS